MKSQHKTMALDSREMTAEELRDALQAANVPTLLIMLVQMTGDKKWMESPFRPTRARGLEDNDDGGLTEKIQKRVRVAAYEAILEWRDGKPIALPRPSDRELVEMLGVAAGETVPEEYGPMIAEDLGLQPEGDRSDAASRTEPPPPGFRAIVIGAGASGIAAAVHLKRAGIPFVILERAFDVGGTWRDNHYPGAGVDTPNHLYCYSFADNDWSRYYALQAEVQGYLSRIACQFDTREHIKFGHTVVSAVYDPNAQEWTIRSRTADGGESVFTASMVISAVGAFNQPKYPQIDGLDRFCGQRLHTAEWDDSLDVDGKTVAVIGNGASAMQLVPAIADDVDSVTVFQRAPQWAAPFEKFKKEVPTPVRRLLMEVPLYRSWYRARLSWTFNDKIHPSLQRDPTWKHPERSVNVINDAHRSYFTRYIKAQLGIRQDLLEKVLPTYPPFGKRMLLDNGWFRTLTRDNVELVTSRVAAVEADGIRTEDGAKREFDVIVYATGFDVVNFLGSIDVRGRSGRSLRDAWDGDDPRAYLGLTVPDFPNLFILYGPNTQAGHGGSLIRMVEIQLGYLMKLLHEMFRRSKVVVECRSDVHEDYNDRIDRAHQNMVWTHPGMDVYYRNARGRVVVNTPFRVIDFWRKARYVDMGDYLTEPSRNGVASVP